MTVMVHVPNDIHEMDLDYKGSRVACRIFMGGGGRCNTVRFYFRKSDKGGKLHIREILGVT